MGNGLSSFYLLTIRLEETVWQPLIEGKAYSLIKPCFPCIRSLQVKLWRGYKMGDLHLIVLCLGLFRGLWLSRLSCRYYLFLRGLTRLWGCDFVLWRAFHRAPLGFHRALLGWGCYRIIIDKQIWKRNNRMSFITVKARVDTPISLQTNSSFYHFKSIASARRVVSRSRGSCSFTHWMKNSLLISQAMEGGGEFFI